MFPGAAVDMVKFKTAVSATESALTTELFEQFRAYYFCALGIPDRSICVSHRLSSTMRPITP